MTVALWPRKLRATSRTKFLLPSFHGGVTGLDTIKMRPMAGSLALLLQCQHMTTRPVQRPPASDPVSDDDPLEQPGGAGHEYDGRTSFERILPELIRRGLEAGRGPLEKVSESIFPKDLTSQLIGQLGDIRSGIVKAVAQEVGRFLRDADIATELRKVLTGLDVEAQVRLRFKAREDGSLKAEVAFELGDDDKSRPAERRKGRER
jgi:hypothetical protein